MVFCRCSRRDMWLKVNCCASLRKGPAMPIQTNPTGFFRDPPEGPAMPVVDRAEVDVKSSRQFLAILERFRREYLEYCQERAPKRTAGYYENTP